MSRGVGLARAGRGHFENAACHANERSSTLRGGLVCASTCHPSDVWISLGGRIVRELDFVLR